MRSITLAGVAAEENGAGIAGASDPALVQFQQVLVQRRKRRGAQLAHLGASRGLRTNRCRVASDPRPDCSHVLVISADRLRRRQVRHARVDGRALVGVDAGGVAGGASVAFASRLFPALVGPLFCRAWFLECARRYQAADSSYFFSSFVAG